MSTCLVRLTLDGFPLLAILTKPTVYRSDPQQYEDLRWNDRHVCNCQGISKGRDFGSQASDQLKVIIVGGISSVCVLFFVSNNLIFLLDQLLHCLGLESLHRLC